MERVDDALNATRAAMELGVIEGGGLVLARLSNTMNKFRTCLIKPYHQILENAGIIKTNKITEINARTNRKCNFLDEGIIDPVKVTLSSLNSAASVAALVLTSEVLVGEKDDLSEQGMF